jgi:Tfp pilus assembly protein PilF
LKRNSLTAYDGAAFNNCRRGVHSMKYLSRAWWIAGLCWALAGCAGVPEARPTPPIAPLFDDAAFGAPSQRIDVAAVFALSPAMERYLEVQIAPRLRRDGRVQGLAEALAHPGALRLEYDSQVTRTAAEAFDARAGNCLSLVLMSAALAKRLDLPVQYQVLVGYQAWSRSGDLTFVSGHVNLSLSGRVIDREPGRVGLNPVVRIEFGEVGAGRRALLKPVDESRIVAMFMNNRAAESLVAGAVDDAYAYVREAARQDPGYSAVYNTLAVVYQRRGIEARAEAALRHALLLDDANIPAMANLAALLERSGRAAEAADWRTRLARLEADTPFQHFDLARAAIGVGDYAAARDHLKRELARDPDYHEFHFWLSVAYNGLGDERRARSHLATAMRNSITRRELAIYESKLRSIDTPQVR